MNLISNAKDAIEHAETKEIIIELKSSGEKHLEMSVSDTGSGIPAEIRQKILSPFFTTKDVGRGTGLGLSFVSEHIKEMKGELSILSKHNYGSKFIVRLPRDLECTKNACSHLDAPISEPVELNLNGRALVVDDEPQIREILGDYIESMGLEVEFAENGKKALDLIEQDKYAFIFSDMKMPGLSGIDFIKEAQKKTTPSTKYIVVTGGVTFDRPEEAKANVEKYINAYVNKPFTKDALQEVLSNLS